MSNVIGIDLGGTKINACLVDKNGNILQSYKLATRAKEGRDAVVSDIVKAIKYLDLEDVSAIGIGTPGFIDTINGVVTFAGNIKGWTGLNLKKVIEDKTHISVFVENDANIALKAEKWLGSCKDYKNVVMITLGTGLGGAVYNEDFGLLYGANFQGAELGHMILYPGGNHCTCGQNGCAESYCSGPAISEDFYRLSGVRITAQEIFSKVEKDLNAKKVLENFQYNLAYFLTSLRNIFDPEAIVIGGGIINSRDVWWDGVINRFKKNCHKSESVDILPAKFLNDAGVIGAARVAFERIEDE